MSKLSKDQLIDAISELSVLELSELVKALEEKFGVSAMPIAVSGAATEAASASASAAEEEPKEEQTTFNVVLAGPGTNKISVIKTLREVIPTLGLKEAKDKVDASEGAPQVILEGVNKATAEEAKKKLETAGAKVELK